MAHLDHIPLGAVAALLLACGPPDPACIDPATTAVQDPAEGRLADRMDRFLNGAAEAGFNGSVLVTRAGRTDLDSGYGLRDRGNLLPYTPATVHAIGSITEQFTAACILKLQEPGRLQVEDGFRSTCRAYRPTNEGSPCTTC